jgi:hypothetical protein
VVADLGGFRIVCIYFRGGSYGGSCGRFRMFLWVFVLVFVVDFMMVVA